MKRIARLTFAFALCVASLVGTGVAHAQNLRDVRPAVTPAIKPGPQKEHYAADYKKFEAPYWKNSFPNLGPKYEILAPFTGDSGTKGAYNCISHTLGVYDRWTWPGNKVSDFDALYGKHGYRRAAALDYGYDPRVEKVVLYATVKGGKYECTHGAKMLADGTWTSKLGGGPLIRHPTPDSVSGASYGKPIAVYVRARR